MTRTPLRLAITAALLGTLPVGAVLAQTTDKASGGLEEVIVTASAARSG